MLQGDNAQGKSNFMEAIYLLATTRSPKSDAERELLNWAVLEESLPFCRVAAEIQRGGATIQLEVVIQARAPGDVSHALLPVQKRIRVNGLVRRAVDVVGLMNVVLFGPSDLELVGGAPGVRRRYLDILNSQVDSRYLQALQQYNRVLLRRNHLLRLIAEGRARSEHLAFWDRELVTNGAYIVFQRQQAVIALDEQARQVHHQLTGGQEHLEIAHVENLASAGELGQISDNFREALKAVQRREIAQGMSLVGPHRSDLRFAVNGRDMRSYASRGQQRTIALALRLAEARFILSRTAEQPVVLLDDVLSELDRGRRRFVLESLEPYGQVVVTTTDLGDLEDDFLKRAALFRVSRGEIEPLA